MEQGTVMIHPIEQPDGTWEVPDAQEFIRGCRWVDGKFEVPEKIHGTVKYSQKIEADIECLMLNVAIGGALEIARSTS